MAGAGGIRHGRIWLLLVGFRGWWQLRLALARHRWTWYAAVAGLLLGVLGLVSTPLGSLPALLSGLAGVLLSVLLLAPEWWALRRGRVRLVQRRDVPTPAVDEQEHLVRLPTDHREVAWCRPDVDEALPRAGATYGWSDERHGLPRRLAAHAGPILAARVRRRRTFNGALVRQDVDLTPSVLRQGEIGLSRTDYYTLLCSNYLFGWRVLDRATGATHLDGSSLPYGEDGRLLPLSQSRLANVIGVSTLALTTDRRLVLGWQQPEAEAAVGGLAAPAGSGSVDLTDVHDRPPGARFTDFLSSAMRRELMEESHLAPHQLGDTLVSGYFRWLNRGGKPEYVGLTELTVSSDDLVGVDVRLVETPYVQALTYDCPLDLDLLRRDPDSLDCLPADVAAAASMPLYMGLRALGRLLRRDDDLFRRLSRPATAG
ncbi:hypothetical protein [Micromonospora robiginosa]|uniref:Nudix hydrolase domain-containing protein n=1 Tax=Micromonospora robiginosa TaxID=2749844 RepID=A0A7L6B5J2_9ACTN|nr:hypothetical protein [Micromonospora ferruginea]QLQ37202.1 hypothetical protein H1D33_28945 [Micromonospora ferruginea]